MALERQPSQRPVGSLRATAVALRSGVRELAEKRFRVSKVGRVEIFGEVALDPRQQVMCVCAFIQPTPQSAQTQRGSKLQRFRVLLASDLCRACENDSSAS